MVIRKVTSDKVQHQVQRFESLFLSDVFFDERNDEAERNEDQRESSAHLEAQKPPWCLFAYRQQQYSSVILKQP